MKKFRTWITIVFLLIAAVVLLYVCGRKPDVTDNSNKIDTLYPAVKNFRDTSIQRTLEKGAQRFTERFGKDIVIDSINFTGEVENTTVVGREMVNSLVAIDSTVNGRYSMSTYESLPDSLNIELGGHPAKIHKEQLTDLLASTTKEGDYKVTVVLKDKKTGKTYSTINSISQDGKRVGGYLFQTSVEPAKETITRDTTLASTDCCEIIVLKYLFIDKPKIKIRACLRKYCSTDNTMTECLLANITVYSDLFTSCKTFPANASLLRNDEKDLLGTIRANKECTYTIRYHCTTGFKRVEASVDKTKFSVDGIIGMDFGDEVRLIRTTCTSKITAD